MEKTCDPKGRRAARPGSLGNGAAGEAACAQRIGLR